MGSFATIFKKLGGVKGTLIITLIIAAGGFVWYQHNQIENAIVEKDKAITENKRLAGELETLVAVNITNKETIKELEKEKENVQEALDKRDADIIKSQGRTKKVEKNIKAQATLKENQTALSPVLKSTLEEIQNERAIRKGQTK